jgi:hypothetical protein
LIWVELFKFYFYNFVDYVHTVNSTSLICPYCKKHRFSRSVLYTTKIWCVNTVNNISLMCPYYKQRRFDMTTKYLNMEKVLSSDLCFSNACKLYWYEWNCHTVNNGGLMFNTVINVSLMVNTVNKTGLIATCWHLC